MGYCISLRDGAIPWKSPPLVSSHICPHTHTLQENASQFFFTAVSQIVHRWISEKKKKGAARRLQHGGTIRVLIKARVAHVSHWLFSWAILFLEQSLLFPQSWRQQPFENRNGKKDITFHSKCYRIVFFAYCCLNLPEDKLQYLLPNSS